MGDWTDDATTREDEERARAIAARRALVAKQEAERKELPALTECMNDCGEAPAEGSNYCSKDCCEMAGLRERQQRRSGVR